MILTDKDLTAMEKLKQVQLVTSLPGAKPLCLVGTKSTSGVSNLAPFSSITHLGSIPPLIGMVTRPDTVERHTLKNILDTECWTLSHVCESIKQAAHQCSAKYPADTSEFVATGLNEECYPDFHAPAVAEAKIKLGLSLEEIIPIKANQTKLIVGKVQFIDIEDSLLREDGSLDLISAGTLASTALDTYFSLHNETTLPYARP